MVFQVDQCKNFKDGKKCEKCGRMMPAYCKDQQDLEEKARKYDEWVATQQVVEVEHVVVEETPEDQQDKPEVTEEEPKVVADVVRPKIARGRPKGRK